MKTARFEAPLIEGHKGVTAVLVPFDPEEVWKQKPVRLAGRRHGWLVKGTANGVKFTGYIGDRWGNFFIAVDEELRAAARVSPGDVMAFVVEPARTKAAWLAACAQSERSTQPGKARPDAVEFTQTQRRTKKSTGRSPASRR